jgi:hypothetical protein
VENTATTGYARLEVKTPNNDAYLQMGKDEGLLVNVPQRLPIVFKTHDKNAMAISRDQDVYVYNGLNVGGNLFSGNFFMERLITSPFTYSTPTDTPANLYTKKTITWGFTGTNQNYGNTLFDGFSVWDDVNNAGYIARKRGVYDFEVRVVLGESNQFLPKVTCFMNLYLLAKTGIKTWTLSSAAVTHYNSLIEVLNIRSKVFLESGVKVYVAFESGMPDNTTIPFRSTSFFRCSLCN